MGTSVREFRTDKKMKQFRSQKGQKQEVKCLKGTKSFQKGTICDQKY